MNQDLSVSVLCCSSWKFVSLFTAPREAAAITVGPLPLRKGVSRRSSIRSRERDFGVQLFLTELVVVNSINFGTAALVVLTVRCHGNEQRMAVVENSSETVQFDDFVRWFFAFSKTNLLHNGNSEVLLLLHTSFWFRN